MSLLKVQGLEKSFGGVHAARDVTFEVSSPKPYARHFCFAAEARR